MLFLYYSSSQFSVVAYCDLFNQSLINNNNNKNKRLYGHFIFFIRFCLTSLVIHFVLISCEASNAYLAFPKKPYFKLNYHHQQLSQGYW